MKKTVLTVEVDSHNLPDALIARAIEEVFKGEIDIHAVRVQVQTDPEE